MKRRSFLTATAATLAMSQIVRANAPRPAIGVQLYMARELLARDFEATIAAIAGTGITQVQTAGFYDREPTVFRRILEENGLTAVSGHALRADMDDAQVARMIDACAAIGMAHAVAPIPLMPGLASGNFAEAIAALTRDDFLRSADRFNRIGEQVKAAGMRFAYHTHALDFTRFDGRYAFDEMIERCDPAFADFELDIGNTIAAGIDPLPYFRKLGARIPLAHLKDWRAPFTPGPATVPPTAPIGEGVVDFAAAMQVMGETGVRHAFIEDENRPADEVIGAIGAARRYLSAL